MWGQSALSHDVTVLADLQPVADVSRRSFCLYGGVTLMFATEEIANVWRKFDDFPMETLTKAWYQKHSFKKKQRDVSLMRDHYLQYGVTGNCFDLALWLLDELHKAGIDAYPIGSALGTPKAHAAVVAIGENGERYLCDLGDQWLEPILIDNCNEQYTEDRLSGFFPAADISVRAAADFAQITYYRPNGKQSVHTYSIESVSMSDFLQAAETSQRTLKKSPLLECRIDWKGERAHWEFDNWTSFLSTTRGLFQDSLLESLDQWCDRIHQVSGFDKKLVYEALDTYKKLRI
jgi:hypothetical protein